MIDPTSSYLSKKDNKAKHQHFHIPIMTPTNTRTLPDNSFIFTEIEKSKSKVAENHNTKSASKAINKQPDKQKPRAASIPTNKVKPKWIARELNSA